MKTILRKQDGLTLVELLVTMVIFVLTITAASNIFTGILTQFKQQSKIAETNIEGLTGLQMMKADIEQAGFGLPWNMGGATYNEAVNDAIRTSWDDTLFNDSTANPPRPVVFGDGGTIANPPINNSDVLVTKATSVGIARAAQRWTYITNAGAANNAARRWTPDTQYENPENNDNVIVIKPMAGSRERELVSSGATIFTTFTPASAYAAPPTLAAAFMPVQQSYDTYLYYGVNTGGAPRMPFNRADYYVRRPADMPVQCSADAGTGILYKATVNHADGQLSENPLLDCVREMQIVFGRDTDNDGASDTFGPLPAALTAEEVRAQLKEVRVYLLAQEGQRDLGYTSPATITATDPDVGAVITFDAAAADLRNFRWKVYTIMAKPYSMR